MKGKLVVFLISLAMFATIHESAVAQETPSSSQGNFNQEQKVENGYSISVRNAFGHITIIGWDLDTVAVSAVNNFDQKPVKARIIEDTGEGRKVLIVVVPQVEYSGNGTVSLQVNVPRKAELQPVRTKSGFVTVSNIDGLFSVETTAGDVKINGAGSVDIQTVTGKITAENIKSSFNGKADEGDVDLRNVGGRVDMVIGRGAVLARNIGGDVSLTSFNSPRINLQCVKGHVEIDDTSSRIELGGIEDDVYVTTSTGEAQFMGSIKPGKRYRLKSLSGFVSMFIPEESSFFASIRTYKGEVKSDFALRKDNSSSSSNNSRQIQGTYGDGGSIRIELDSFSGAARLRKILPEAIKKCEL